MNTKDFTTWKSSELAIEKTIEFVIKNFLQKNEDGTASEIDPQLLNDFKRELVYIVDASTLDVQNATGNFIKQFNKALFSELRETVRSQTTIKN